MYSPHSDLVKMFYSPSFIVFRVLIDNEKEYWGRPSTIRTGPFDHPIYDGKFDIYASIDGFMRGNILGNIEVKKEQIKGLEAYDIINPEPLKRILSICNEFESIPNNADIGIIKIVVPEILNRLLVALNDFQDLHEYQKFEAYYDDIEETISQCENALYTVTNQQREDLINYSKERVSTRVTWLIERADKKT